MLTPVLQNMPLLTNKFTVDSSVVQQQDNWKHSWFWYACQLL